MATPRTSSEAMRDVDSLRITLPEPEPSPLNNLTRRTGKPQWKTILQSIHPAITQQVASKLKKVQNNQHFEKELAKFDETMLRFNYKFGVLLVCPDQKCEEDWFGNQTGASTRFQEFLESGALGQKVMLKGFERFSAGLDTRLGETGDYSYFDTWGDGFEIMYHVSTMLPFNTLDPQQIQRKRHIGNDIVCIVFVDGDQPFVPNAIKSQFLHIFAIIHPISLPDGTKGYSVTIACDEQVPEFGPPLPDPPIFRNSTELRAFLLCKMINGENAAYKAPRLIKPHQRARSGLLENLVAKANTLAKDSSKKQKAAPQASAIAATSTAGHPMLPMTSNASFSSDKDKDNEKEKEKEKDHQGNAARPDGHFQPHGTPLILQQPADVKVRARSPFADPRETSINDSQACVRTSYNHVPVYGIHSSGVPKSIDRTTTLQPSATFY
ncbi:Rap/ran-GAP protein [Podila epicladia]|nr:Rap/ran-GAP protein [Podila epicladia]